MVARFEKWLRWTALGSVLALGLGLSNCTASKETVPPPSANTSTEAVPVTAPSVSPVASQIGLDRMKLRQNDDTELFSIKFQEDGAKLLDSANAELARFIVYESNKVKIKSATDEVLGYVVPSEGKWQVKNAEQDQNLYILRRQDDGDYKLDDGTNSTIYRVQVRAYGYEIETSEKQSLYAVKQKGPKISLDNVDAETVIFTKADVIPMAIAPFGFDVLTKEQQAALSYALTVSGGR